MVGASVGACVAGASVGAVVGSSVVGASVGAVGASVGAVGAVGASVGTVDAATHELHVHDPQKSQYPISHIGHACSHISSISEVEQFCTLMLLLIVG